MEVEYDNIASGSGHDWELDTVRIYIPAPGGRAGAAELDPNSTSPLDHKYLLYYYDHLGSIQAIIEHGSTTLAWDFSSSARQTLYSYEPWGQRRDPSDWLGSANSQTTYTWGGQDDRTPRGFTGREQLDDLGLIHMNGRIYDPLLGRFLSADILVQNPGSVQSYNRYSYVFNNPLRYTDSSGYNTDEEVEREKREEREREADIRSKMISKLGILGYAAATDQTNYWGISGTILAAEVNSAASEQADPSPPAAQTVEQEAPDTGSDEGEVAADKPAGDEGAQGTEASAVPVPVPAPPAEIIPFPNSQPAPNRSPWAILLFWSLLMPGDSVQPDQTGYNAAIDAYHAKFGDEDPAGTNIMRLQLQTGRDNIWSMPIIGVGESGVTTQQVQMALGIMAAWSEMGGNAAPASSSNRKFVEAIVRMSEKVNGYPPTGTLDGGNIERVEFRNWGTLYRIDLENLRGHNLRR